MDETEDGAPSLNDQSEEILEHDDQEQGHLAHEALNDEDGDGPAKSKCGFWHIHQSLMNMPN